jgi:hypothetical protein
VGAVKLGAKAREIQKNEAAFKAEPDRGLRAEADDGCGVNKVLQRFRARHEECFDPSGRRRRG